MKFSIIASFLLFVAKAISQDATAPEPKVNCPLNSLYGEESTKFIVTTVSANIYPHFGDFYSQSWPNILFAPDNFTFTPPTRTIVFNGGNNTLSEYLLLNSSTADSFMLRWELSSDPFKPTGRFDVVYYQQSINVYPVCDGGLLSSVVWKTRACIYGDPGIGMTWFKERHNQAIANIFSGIEGGWMGGPETTVGNCYGLNNTFEANKTNAETETDILGPNGVAIYTPVPELNSAGVKSYMFRGGELAAVLVLAAGTVIWLG
ncbi:uncharacterized protein H6S33_001338 [Morchella sextelata]|uniref:uncharacterized protein n=1 Tax=Morchella sextelata TaxID=1174677 RepID=UPI001D03D71F|nr:uncharacterized protein H6S33_001338 [Morchella sextelata]KAH0609110.1 hypothetical protein H6S33_001338 [Morchella sextelata]